jgi:hypothetical protein
MIRLFNCTPGLETARPRRATIICEYGLTTICRMAKLLVSRHLLNGAVSEDRSTIHHARMRQEVYSRVVRAEAIVPKRDIAKFPTPPNRELRLGHVFE